MHSDLVTYNKHAKQSQDCYVIKFKGASEVHIYFICFLPYSESVDSLYSLLHSKAVSVGCYFI